MLEGICSFLWGCLTPPPSPPRPPPPALFLGGFQGATPSRHFSDFFGECQPFPPPPPRETRDPFVPKVSLLSAVAFNVLSTLHQIPIVAAGHRSRNPPNPQRQKAVKGNRWRKSSLGGFDKQTDFALRGSPGNWAPEGSPWGCGSKAPKARTSSEHPKPH